VALLLIIDPVAASAAEVAHALAQAGHEVRVVNSLAAAAAAAESAPPELIVADADVVGLDAAVALHQVAALADTPVVLLADTEHSGWDRSLEGAAIFEADALLDKPVDLAALASRVAGILAARAQAVALTATPQMDEIIQRAIAGEEMAHRFYQHAAATASQPETKDLLLQLAQDELEHRRLLVEFEQGQRPLPVGPPPPGSRLTEFVGAPDFNPDLSPLDALLLAVRKEQLAAELYGSWAGLYPPGPEADLLRELSAIEWGHKERVERIFAAAAYPETWD
jgi:rubrerythrin